MANRVGPNRWNCCGTFFSIDQVEASDYRLTASGKAMAAVQCERGHRITPFIAAEALPPDCPLELKRAYVMGAMVGFALGRRKAGETLAEVVREMADWMPVKRISLVTNLSESHIRRMVLGEYPKPLKGEYQRVAEQILKFG